MNLHPRNFYNPVKQKTRRYDLICKLLNLKETDTVLNVGCGEGLTFENFNKVNPITAVDVFPESKIHQENVKYLTINGDGHLPFKDKEFDVAIAIGVLEHIHPLQALQLTCKEMSRVSKRFLVLVPNYYTLIEPHYAFPLFQLFPISFQKALHNALNLRLESKPRSENKYEEINYFKTKDWLKFFPQNTHYMIYNHIGPFITNLIMWGENN